MQCCGKIKKSRFEYKKQNTRCKAIEMEVVEAF